MSTDTMQVTAPEENWLAESFGALEEVLEQPVDLWSRTAEGYWTLVAQSNENEALDVDGSADRSASPVVIELLETAADRGRASAAEVEDNRYLLAIPLSGRVNSVALSTVTTDNVELLIGMATISQRLYQQQEQLIRLREENDYFLKQISDDFEELTFLRSMAERLTVGKDHDSIGRLLEDSVPRLGESAHAEALYFVEAAATIPGWNITGWHDADANPNVKDESLARRLVDEYCEAAHEQPVIRNRFLQTEAGREYPGVQCFLLVSVRSSLRPIGWYLAINRRHSDTAGQQGLPNWRLSQHEFGTSEASLLSTAGAMLASHANNLSFFREREALLVKVVRTLVSAIEAKDKYTCGHSERVAVYGKRLAQQVGYSREECERLYLTGLLHDIGKIAVSDAVLNKAGQLTKEEFAEIKRHPDEGWTILRELEQLSYVLPGVLHHHERADGKGYPDGLAGANIPLDGRILAVADAYDAMTSNRAYREGLSHQEAEDILRQEAGTQWDAEVIDAFLQVAPDIVALRENYRPRQQHLRKPGD